MSADSLNSTNLLGTSQPENITVLGESQPQLSFNDTTLINFYKLESNGFDSSSSGDLLTLSGSPSYVTGYFGQAINFSGSSQYAFATQSNNIYNSPFTIMFWFKADINNRALFSIGDTATDSSPEILVRYQSTNKTSIYYKQNGVTAGYGNGLVTVSIGQWYFYSLTYDGISNFTQYINGTVDNSFNGTETANGGSIYIGSGYQDYFDGIIDEVAIFNTNLSSEQINNIKTTGLSGYELSGNLKLRHFNISSGNEIINLNSSHILPTGTNITERMGYWDGLTYLSPSSIYAHFSFDSLITDVANEIVDRIQGFLGTRNSTALSITDDEILNRGVYFDGVDDFIVINHTENIFVDGETQALWEKDNSINPVFKSSNASQFGTVWYDGDTEEYLMIAPNNVGNVVRQNSTDGLTWENPVVILSEGVGEWDDAIQVSNTLKEENLALDFNTTNYANTTLSHDLYQQNWTVSIWINAEDVTNNKTLFSIGDTPTDSTPQILFKFDEGKLNTYATDGTVGYKLFDYVFSEDNWYHLIIEHTETTQTLYVNGVQNSTITSNDTSNSEENLYLGAGYDGDGNTFFNGSIDEFRFYNRTLNSTEITDLYNNEKIERNHLTREGLLLWLPMNDNSTSQLIDRSDNVANATLISTDLDKWIQADKWYMLYRGYSASTSYKAGLATSDDSYSWVKYANNPLNDSTTGLRGNFDPMSGIRINDTYYLFMNGDGGHGVTNLLTTHDFIKWEYDARNPIFWDEQYCDFVWYDSISEYYYMIIPYDNGDLGETFLYSNNIQLFRSREPTFYPEQREYLGIVATNDESYDDKYLDTPSCFMTDIYRNESVRGEDLWCYYNSYSSTTGQTNSFFNTTQSFINSLSPIRYNNYLYNENQTVCMWINPSDTRAGFEYFYGLDRKLDEGEWANEPQHLWGLSNSDKQSLEVRNGKSLTYRYSNSAIPKDTWSFVCYEFMSNESNILNSSFRFWKNGIVDSEWQTGSFMYRHPQYIYVGAIYDTYFNGSIDDLIIYNRTLTTQEHEDLFLRGLADVTYSSWNQVNNETGNNYFLMNSSNYIFLEYHFSTSDSSLTPSMNLSGIIYSLTVVDVPNITLVSPADSYSETSSSATINFQFNVSDDLSNISYCSLFLDGIEHANTSAISETETNTISVSSIGAGSHSWKVFCNDTLGNGDNSSTRSFTINAPSSETSNTGGSSASVSLGETENFVGKTNLIRYGFQNTFEFGGEEHKFILRKIDRNLRTAEIDVYSDKKVLTLTEGSSENVDLDGDGEFDLVFYLEKIYDDKVAVDLRIESFSSSSEGEIEVVESGEFEEIVEDETSLAKWILIFGVLVIVGIVVLVLLRVSGKKNFK